MARVQADVSTELKKRVQLASIELQKTQSEIVVMALEDYLTRLEKKTGGSK